MRDELQALLGVRRQGGVLDVQGAQLGPGASRRAPRIVTTRSKSRCMMSTMWGREETGRQ